MWFLFLRRYSHVQNLRSNGHGRVRYQRFSLQLKKQSQNIFDTIFSWLKFLWSSCSLAKSQLCWSSRWMSWLLHDCFDSFIHFLKLELKKWSSKNVKFFTPWDQAHTDRKNGENLFLFLSFFYQLFIGFHIL